MNPSITIVTPGTFPIPSSKTSSVENTILHQAPYLAQHVSLMILGRKFPATPQSCIRAGAKYVNFVGNQRTYLNRVILYCHKNPPDVIQVENRPQYVQKLKKKLPGISIWLSLHSITFLAPKRISAKDLCIALELVEKVIVNSEYVKQYVLQRFPAFHDKIVVNYLGVDERKFASRFKDQVQALRQQDLKRIKLYGKRIVLYVGRLIPTKGVHHLIDSFHQVQQKHPDTVLLIVGGNTYGKNRSTSYVQHLKRISQKNKESIHFIPFTSYSAIHRWYRLADVVVVPSIASEAFGLVNLEALSTGIPVVASNIGGIPEIIKHRENGLLVSTEDLVQQLTQALDNILANQLWAQQLGRKGRDDIEKNFTWQQSAQRLVDLYRKKT